MIAQAEAPKASRLRQTWGKVIHAADRFLSGPPPTGTPEWIANPDIRREMAGIRHMLERSLEAEGGTRVGNEVLVGLGDDSGRYIVVRGKLDTEWQKSENTYHHGPAGRS